MMRPRAINIAMIALVLFAIAGVFYFTGLTQKYTEPGQPAAENAAIGVPPADIAPAASDQ